MMTEPKIPKFGSFKPAKSVPAPAPLSDVPSVKQPSTKQGTEKKHPTSGRHDDHRRRHHGRHRSPRKEESQVRTEPSRAHEHQETFDRTIFVVDRRGDEKNLIYGSIHRYDIPPFHRFGAGYVLGLTADFKIDRDRGDDKGVTISRWRDSRTKTREKYVFAKVAKERPRLLKIRPEVAAVGSPALNGDFIRLVEPRAEKRKRGDVQGDSSDSEKDQRDYRSIYGSKKSKDIPSDEELQYATESELSGSDVGYSLKKDPSILKKNISLSKRVEESPHDIENWLALIDHQDVLLRSGDDRRRVTNAEVKSTAEIKIHMYEKALDKMMSMGDRERILQGLMTEGAKVWEVKAQSDRWEQISNDNIDSLVLWTSYLNFKQSNFTTFHYEEVKGLFLNRIKLLTRAVTTAKPNSIIPIFNQLFYVLLRLTLFIRESGYSELAIAIWQANLEMNFFGTPQPLPRDKSLQLFRDFWESEVPRIGEEGALGWQRFMEDEASSETHVVVVDEEDNNLDDKLIFESWAGAERLRARVALPARTMDEVVEDDPFRVILVSDIEEYLILLPPEAEDLRKLFVDSFLLFCRLPNIASNSDCHSQVWALDPFVNNNLLECELNWPEHRQDIEASHDVKEGHIKPIFKQTFPNYRRSADTMFSSQHWFGAKSWQDQYAATNEPVPYGFVRNTLKQLALSTSIEGLAEYCLAFENINEPDTIKKTSKSILKRHPSSLQLYNAYAMIEWPRDKEVAQGVFSAALNMGLASKNETNSGTILLWKSWVWACMEDGDTGAALGLLLSIADGKPIPNATLSPALVLKSRQHLSSNRDFFLSSGDLNLAVIHAECLALLDYLTGDSNAEPKSSVQGDIASALLSYTNSSYSVQNRSQSTSAAHELLLQSASRLLFLHARAGPYRPSLLRIHLSNFIERFPQNTIFVSLYAWNERNLRVESKVRSILSSTILTPRYDNVASRIFAINHEISNGTIYSARAAFEHALASPTCKNSAGVWRFYLLYVLFVPEFRAKAKEVWYRALRACPWAKELYVLGFEKLRAMGMGFREMKSCWRVMGEKELRVHVDLEDKFEDIGELEDGGGAPVKDVGRKKLGYK